MRGRRWLPALLVLFIGSGCAALIYEVVWFQLLQLSVGSSAVSLGILLGIFMGGMCLGSLLLPRLVSARHHPLRVYALLELGIGALGVVVLFVVPLIGGVYTTIAGTGQINLFLRAIVAGICLLPPTILMGATLPAIARFVEATPSGVSWLGYFYGGNIGGAVVGCLLAGLLPAACLRHADRDVRGRGAQRGGGAPGARHRAHHRLRAASRRRRARDAVSPESRLIYVAIALSGMTALGAEVVWTRILSLLFGATTYTFSLILAVFLVGLGRRQHDRVGAGAADGASALCARLVPAAAVRHHRVGRAFDGRFAAVLADQSVALDQPDLQLPARSDARHLGAAAVHPAVGRQLSRSRSPRLRCRARIRGGSSAASMPPTPSAPSSARSSRGWCWSARWAARCRSRS